MRSLQDRRARIAIAVLALLVVTLGLLAFRDRLDKAHVVLVYLLVVLGGSAAEGRRVGFGLAIASFLCFNFLFLAPYYRLTISDPLDWLVLITFLATSVVAAELLARLRRNAELAELRAVELDRLSTLGAETLNAARAEQALTAIAAVIRSAIGVDHCALFVRDGGSLRPIGDPGPESNTGSVIGTASLLEYVAQTGHATIQQHDATARVISLDSSDDLQQPLRQIRALLLPLAIRGETVGALRITSVDGFSLGREQRRVLLALAYYAALGIERLRLERSEETAESLRRADRLKDALLASVSHDLRTPLTTIKAIANEIAHGGDSARASVIEDESDRLSKLVDGLLQLSELDAGALPMTIEINTVDDLVGAAVERAGGALRHHPVNIEMGGELLAGRFDFAHTMRVVINLLENAAKYSPPGSPITVAAHRLDGRIQLMVSDRGTGVDPSERDRIFEPFYRAPGATPDVRGSGLGLAIARGLAEAQQGNLRVLADAGGGSRFVLEFPAAELPVE